MSGNREVISPGFLSIAYLVSRGVEPTDAYGIKLRRGRTRGTFAVLVGGSLGLAILLTIPSGQLYIDNATQSDVRLFLDGREWLVIGADKSLTRSLTSGYYNLTVKSLDDRHLDSHEINVSPFQRHVLNVLGQQVYFQGTMQYGIDGGSMRSTNEKWFLIPDVDYLFRNPPARIISQNPMNKTFITKAIPPIPKGDRRE